MDLAQAYTARVPIRVERFEETPNPNALKCVLAGRLPAVDPPERPLRSYGSLDAARAAGDDIGAALLAIPGVVSALVTPEWVTVVKAQRVEWKRIKPAISDAIARLTSDIP